MAYQRKKRAQDYVQPAIAAEPSNLFASPNLEVADSEYSLSETETDDTATLDLRRKQASPGGFDFGAIPLFQRSQANPLPMQRQARPSLLQAKLTVGPAGDQYEQEADRVAAQVVKTLNSPKADKPVQRQGMDEEEDNLQMKPDRNGGQRQWTKPQISDLQMKPLVLQRQPARQPNLLLQMHNALQRQQPVGSKGGTVSGNIESSIQSERGGGQPLEASVREPMEQAFGADFSGVNIHTDSKADTLNRSLGSRAFTTGPDLFFKKEEYNPNSSDGQELLAHELTHVVQQGGAKLNSKSNIQTQPIRVQRRSKPNIQRLITREHLYDVRTPLPYDTDYNMLLDMVDEYHDGVAKEKLGTLDTISEDAESDDAEIGRHLKALNEIHELADELDAKDDSGFENHPVYGLLKVDIEQEKRALNRIYTNRQEYYGKTLYQALQSDDGNPSNPDTYIKFVELSGVEVPDVEEADDAATATENTPAQTGWLGKVKKGFTNPTAGGNSKRLILEGAGHLIASGLLLGLGIAACSTGVGALTGGVSLVVGGAGQIGIGILKFVRAYLAAKSKKLNKKKDQSDADKTKLDKWASMSAVLVSVEALIGTGATVIATLLAPLPFGIAAILKAATGSASGLTKFLRGLLMLKKAKSHSKDNDKLINLLQAGEVVLGLITGIIGQLGLLLKTLAQAGGSMTVALIKSTKAIVSGLVNSVKAQRNIAGQKKIIADSEAQQADESALEERENDPEIVGSKAWIEENYDVSDLEDE